MSGSWSMLAAREILEIACKAQGIVYTQFELLRFGNTAIYLLAPDPLIARVSRPGSKIEAAAEQMHFCRWLGEKNFPIVTPSASAAPEPLQVMDAVVSFWHYLPHQKNAQLDAQQFGQLINSFHHYSADYPYQLSDWNPMPSISRRLREIDKSDRLSAEDSALLWQWVWQLEEQLSAINSQLGFGPLYGGAHYGNAVLTESGLTLTDPEHLCYGPREWDLIPAVLGPRRFGGPKEDYFSFSKGYGYDVTSSPSFEPLVLARELFITVLRLRAEVNNQVHAEGERRLKYWRRDPLAPVWKPF